MLRSFHPDPQPLKVSLCIYKKHHLHKLDVLPQIQEKPHVRCPSSLTLYLTSPLTIPVLYVPDRLFPFSTVKFQNRGPVGQIPQRRASTVYSLRTSEGSPVRNELFGG